MISPELHCWVIRVFSALCVLLPLSCAGDDPYADFRRHPLPESSIRFLDTPTRFSSVRGITVSGETIWVLDSEPPFLTRLGWGSDGELSCGKKGRGPGEFLNPRAIQPYPPAGSGGALVWDFGSGRMVAVDGTCALKEETRFHESGLIRGRADLPEVSFLDPYRIRVNDSTAFANRFYRRLDHSSDLAHGALVRASLNLTSVDTVLSFMAHVPMGVESLKEWAPHPIWDFCDGHIVLWSPRAAKLIWMDPSGEVQTEKALDLPTTPVRARDIERYMERMAELEMGPDYRDAGINFSQLGRANQDRFAENRPGVTGMLCGEGGDLWLRLFGTDADPLGRGREWLLIRPGEDPLLIRYPRAFTPLLFSRVSALGVIEIPMEGQALAWMDYAGI